MKTEGAAAAAASTETRQAGFLWRKLVPEREITSPLNIHQLIAHSGESLAVGEGYYIRVERIDAEHLQFVAAKTPPTE
jgi:hypothetical protein